MVAGVAASPTSSPVVMNLQTKYRDRARKRRQLHGYSVLEESDELTTVTGLRGRINGGKIRAIRGNVFEWIAGLYEIYFREHGVSFIATITRCSPRARRSSFAWT